MARKMFVSIATWSVNNFFLSVAIWHISLGIPVGCGKVSRLKRPNFFQRIVDSLDAGMKDGTQEWATNLVQLQYSWSMARGETD